MGSLSDWNSFFNASRRPNFGDVQAKYGTPDFEKEYLWSSSLKEFHYRLLDTLTGAFEMLNMLITGNPGVGKTSFLYYLRHRFETDQDQKYVLKIFHVNRAAGFSSDDEQELQVQEEIYDAWKDLYMKCGHELTFKQIDSSNGSVKKTIVELGKYYLKNKSKFPYILIFAVDDVDLLESEALRKLIKYVIANLEAKSVKKWFFVRPQTYQNYDRLTKEFLQGFFPDVRELPKTRLYDLVKHRVAAVSGDQNPKTPFSPHLCGYIEQLVDGNIRRGFPALEHILCEAIIPQEDRSEEFVRQYIDRISIKSLIGLQLIPDIHATEFRCVPFPIALDIIKFAMHSSDLAVIKACVLESTRDRYRRYNAGIKRRVTNDTFVSPYPRDTDIGFTVESLVKQQLMDKSGGAYVLTTLGKVVCIFAAQGYFIDKSEASSSDSIDYSEDYIKLAKVDIDHRGIAENYILRKF